MYIVVQNLVKCVKTELQNNQTGDYFADKSVKRVANVCNWLVAIGRKIKLDMAVMAFQDLGNNVDEFQRLIVEDEFDVVCPDFAEFCTESNVIFSN